ncbi:MAG: pseudouridylate synthase [Myxococcales bacterium]|nr:pseudouridylate synthase [Myxococcales bacterium]
MSRSPLLAPEAVRFRDDYVVAVAKPSGMVVHRGWANDGLPLLQAVRDTLGQYVYPIHRIDRGASGVVLFALSSEAARVLGIALAAGEFTKTYVALTRGVPVAGDIDHALQDEDGVVQAARTTVAVRHDWGRYALVEAVPHTGRTHQIRRHLKHVSCPLIGDVRYGKGPYNRLFRTHYGLARLALHAESLAFTHPHTGARMLVTAPLPNDFAACVAQLAHDVRVPGHDS